MNVKAKGYILGAIAAASYGMNPLFALPLYKNGMNPDSVLFFRYLLAIPILAIMVWARGQSFRIQRNQIIPLIVLGLLIALSSLTLFQSYNYMDAGVASTLLFIYPIIVALIMAVFFKERLSWKTLLCILLALSGIAMLSRTSSGTPLSLTGVIIVMVSAISYAAYIVGVNHSSAKTLPTVTLTFYVLIFGLSIFLFRVDFGRELYLVDKWYLWGNLLALALFPTVISFLCTTQAVLYVGSTPTAILGALEPLTAVLFGVTVFGESLSPRMVAGIAMIIIAVTLIIAGGNITTVLVRFRKLFPKLPLRKRHKPNI